FADEPVQHCSRGTQRCRSGRLGIPETQQVRRGEEGDGRSTQEGTDGKATGRRTDRQGFGESYGRAESRRRRSRGCRGGLETAHPRLRSFRQADRAKTLESRRLVSLIACP